MTEATAAPPDLAAKVTADETGITTEIGTATGGEETGTVIATGAVTETGAPDPAGAERATARTTFRWGPRVAATPPAAAAAAKPFPASPGAMAAVRAAAAALGPAAAPAAVAGRAAAAP